MIRKNNKRALYESIMKDVSKTIKKELYENIDDGEDIYTIKVTANLSDDMTSITIYYEELPANIIIRNNNFLRYLNKNFPLLNWELDDGEDTKFTDYIQYVAYPSNDKNEYILATWTKQ